MIPLRQSTRLQPIMPPAGVFAKFPKLPAEIRVGIWQHANHDDGRTVELEECTIDHSAGDELCFVSHVEKRIDEEHCHYHDPAMLTESFARRCECLDPWKEELDTKSEFCRGTVKAAGHRRLWYHLCRRSHSTISPLTLATIESRAETLACGTLTILSNVVLQSSQMKFNWNPALQSGLFFPSQLPRHLAPVISADESGTEHIHLPEQKIEISFRGAIDTLVINILHLCRACCIGSMSRSSRLFIDGLKSVRKMILLPPRPDETSRPTQFNSFAVLGVLRNFPNLRELHFAHCSAENHYGPLVLGPPLETTKEESPQIFDLFQRQIEFMFKLYGHPKARISFSCARRDNRGQDCIHCRCHCTDYSMRGYEKQVWIPVVKVIGPQGPDQKGMRVMVEQWLMIVGKGCPGCSFEGDCGNGFLCREVKREVKEWEKLADSLKLSHDVDVWEDPDLVEDDQASSE